MQPLHNLNILHKHHPIYFQYYLLIHLFQKQILIEAIHLENHLLFQQLNQLIYISFAILVINNLLTNKL